MRPGYAGGASSFGSLLSAAGGTVPSDPNTFVAPPPGGNAGQYSRHYTYLLSSNYDFMCLPGANGWLPDRTLQIPRIIVFGTMDVSSSSVNSRIGYDLAGDYGPASLLDARSDSVQPGSTFAGIGFAGCAAGYPDGGQSSHDYSYGRAYGPGGIGFGAGGGRTPCNAYYSANSGGIQQTAIKLASMSSIAVTVGKGGAARKWTKSQSNYVEGSYNTWSGAGADGCVAVFW